MGYMILWSLYPSESSHHYVLWGHFYNHLHYCSLFYAGENWVAGSPRANGILPHNIVIVNELLGLREMMSATE